LVEVIGLSEVFTRVSSFVENFVDSIGITDTIAKIKDFIKGFLESITPSDTASKNTSKGAKTDSVSLTDSYSIVQVLLKTFTESIALLEQFATDLDKFFSRLFTETLKVNDVYSRILDKVVSFSEALGIADIVSKVLPSLDWRESISIQDDTFKKSMRSLSESINLSDIFDKAVNFARSFVESITLAETWVKQRIKQFSDSIVASEAFNIAQVFLKTFTEGLIVIDTVAKKTVTSFSEAVSLVDSYLKTAIKALTENISITDTVTKAVTIIKTSAITIADSIKRRVNGMLILWEKTKALIGEWTKTASDAQDYTSTTVMREVGYAYNDPEIPYEDSTVTWGEFEAKRNVWDGSKKSTGEYSTIEKDVSDWTKLKDENE
jgi:hypothetical protein